MGDAFTGAFAVALLEGQTMPLAAAFVAAASDLAVAGYDGSQPSCPTRERLQEHLCGLARNTTVEARGRAQGTRSASRAGSGNDSQDAQRDEPDNPP